jgi:hypothetical protein
MVGLRSPKTLRRHFRHELSGGMAEANAVVARVAYEMAFSGRYTVMTLFWCKCQAGSGEKLEREPERTTPGDCKVTLRFPDKRKVVRDESEELDAAA